MFSCQVLVPVKVEEGAPRESTHFIRKKWGREGHSPRQGRMEPKRAIVSVVLMEGGKGGKRKREIDTPKIKKTPYHLPKFSVIKSILPQSVELQL